MYEDVLTLQKTLISDSVTEQAPARAQSRQPGQGCAAELAALPASKRQHKQSLASSEVPPARRLLSLSTTVWVGQST